MELKAYLTPLQKWWWLILASTVIAAVSSYAAASQQAAIYQARATLLVGSAINNPNPTGNEFWLSQQLAQTYTDIAERDITRNAVMESVGLNFLPAYTVRAVADTQLIEIVVTDSSPERAMVVANEIARHLILQTPTNKQAGVEGREEFIGAQLDELEQKIEETGGEILAKQEELAGLFSARQIADTQGQIAALESKRNTLQGNYAALLASTSQGAANSLSIIEDATTPQVPIGPEVFKTVLTSMAIGLSLAVAASYLLEYLDDTIKSTQDVYREAALPTLSGIGVYRPGNGAKLKSRLVTIAQPREPISEAYRGLRTAILFSNIDKPVRTLLVTSPGAGDGKSYTAANLAAVMAQAGHRVLLIDADLRKPTLNKYFRPTKSYGLTDLMVDLSAKFDPKHPNLTYSYVNRALNETEQKGLCIMSSGSLPPNPAEIVGSIKMKSLLGILQRGFDYIIIDSPPVLAVTDAVILSARVDSVLLVVAAGATRGSQLAQAVTQLEGVRANVSGIVLNRLPARKNEFGYDYYYAASDNDQLEDSENGKIEGLNPEVHKRTKPRKGMSQGELASRPLG